MSDGREDGMRVRREVLGDEHVDRAAARTTEFTREFQDLITRYAWGEIWTRPGLDRRTRSCITLTALVAGGRLEELAMHVRAARRNGLSEDEIKEVLLQCAIYCGVPAANAAFAVGAARAGGGRTQGGDMSTVELEQQRLFIGGEWAEAEGAATFDASTRTPGRSSRARRPATRADARARSRPRTRRSAAGPEPPPVERRGVLTRRGRPDRRAAPQIAGAMTEEVGATFGWGMFNGDLAARMLREAAAQTHTPAAR